MAKLVNFIGFQLVWLICVVSASRQLPWTGLVLAGVFVAVTLATSRTPKADLLLVVLAMFGGSLLDTLWAQLSIMDYAASPWGAMAPPWILGLWAAFAITLNHSLAWLRFRYGWMGLLAALACPLSYYAGERMGAVEWLKPVYVLSAVPVSWAFFLSFLCLLNHKLLTHGGVHAVTLD